MQPCRFKLFPSWRFFICIVMILNCMIAISKSQQQHSTKPLKTWSTVSQLNICGGISGLEQNQLAKIIINNQSLFLIPSSPYFKTIHTKTLDLQKFAKKMIYYHSFLTYSLPKWFLKLFIIAGLEKRIFLNHYSTISMAGKINALVGKSDFGMKLTSM